MVDSIRILTTSFTHQEQVDLEFKRRMDTLNATLMGALPITNRISRLEASLLSFNHSISMLSSLTNTNHKQLITMTNDLYNVKNNVSTLQGTLGHQASSQMSTLYNQYTDIYTKLASLKVEFDSAKRDLQNLQSVETSDNQYAHSHITSLSSKYTSLSSLVREIERRVSNLEHNLEEEVLSDIRLVDGDYTGEGRLEVEYHDRWGTVCDDSFTDSSAKVACRQLGYHSQHAVYKGVAPYGEGSGDIVLDNVVCTGDESSLAVCRHHGFMLENCAHSEDVGVICFDIRLEEVPVEKGG
uniref:Deleted in malignant brain tumors 1 protein-like n=1 Tax=Crassostrea virginica TaxID=6565 RepID=A0A8B8ACJ4_CRAVI|nr:deleted in malignant brain tumors 1 protein-like [Crassostrea virginica]